MQNPVKWTDGWHRLPNENGIVAACAVKIAELEPKFWWVRILGKNPVAICCLDEDNLQNQDALFTDAMMNLAGVWLRETGHSPYWLLLRSAGLQECRHNESWTDVRTSCPGLRAQLTYDSDSVIFETKLINEVVERLTSILRRTLREFPTCGRGGTIRVIGRLDREKSQVIAGFSCNSGR